MLLWGNQIGDSASGFLFFFFFFWGGGVGLVGVWGWVLSVMIKKNGECEWKGRWGWKPIWG